MKRYAPLAVAALCCLLAGAEPVQPAGLIHFKKNGFVIAPLDDQITQGTVISMYLKVEDKLSPNVNVMRQPYNDSLDAYLDLSKKQFEGLKMTILKEQRPAKNIATLDYTGTIANHDLHFYARILWTPDHIVLATATGPQKNWDAMSAKLTACVDSVDFEKP